VDRAGVLAQIDALYFFDYVTFTGALRNYVVRSLEKDYKQAQAPTPAHRQFFVLSVFKEEYSAYEDLGAFIRAFLMWRKKEIEVPIQGIFDYRCDDVRLNKVLCAHNINSGNDLFDRIGLSEFIPSGWTTRYSSIDLEQSLRTMTQFFVDDCQRNQKEEGVRAYNKIKHGPVAVPDASIYLRKQPDYPAVIIDTIGKNQDKPLTLWAVPSTDEHLENRLKAIEFIQNNLRLMAGLYLCHQYQPFLIEKGFKKPIDLFRHQSLGAVLEFLEKVTR
jgi:hypothetical protein